MRHAPLFAVSALVMVAAGGVGCLAGPAGPSADDGAAHLGLVEGRTLTYASSTGATETHEFTASDLQVLGGLTVGLLAKENGFAKESRSLTFAVDVTQASLARFFSCLNDCATVDAPIAFIGWPLEEGARVEGEATVTESRNAEVVQIRTERHTTTIGPAADVSVPAGTFNAFIVSWAKTIIDAAGAETTETAVLHWAPDVGIVRHETFDGVTLDLQVAP
jgi:hypothetical protein